jgi:hypothetical protein
MRRIAPLILLLAALPEEDDLLEETDRGYRRMGEFLQRWLDDHRPASS